MGAGPTGGPRLSDRTVVAVGQQPRAAMNALKVGSRLLANGLLGHNGRLAPLFSRMT